MSIQDTRRANLRAWVQKHGTPTKEKSYFSQILSGTSPIGERAARRLERDYRMGEGFLDAESETVADPSPDPAPALASTYWPFPSTPEADVRTLPADDIQLLDSILAGAMKAILNRSTPSKSMAEQVLNASGLSETPKKKIRETEK